MAIGSSDVQVTEDHNPQFSHIHHRVSHKFYTLWLGPVPTGTTCFQGPISFCRRAPFAP